MGHWTYVLLFLGAALESAAFLGFLVPGETIVVLGGVLSSMGVLALPQTLVVAVIGAIIGDNVGYYLGHRLGRPWLDRHPRLAKSHGNVVERVDEIFERHGGKAVLVGRFVGFLRALLPFVAGASRMRYRTFVFYNAIGATGWGVGFVLLGYFLGESWPIVEKWIGRVGIAVGTVAIIAAWLWLRRRSRHRDQPGSR